jgi:hypothetical protein
MPSISPERLTGFNIGLGFVGVLLTGWLAISELFRGPTCPTLIGVPACYIVLAAYLGATVGAWFSGTTAGNALFVAGAGVVTVVGAWFSIAQVLGSAECPTFEGLPMCYVSLLAGVTMLAIDQVRRRTSSVPADPAT